MLLFNVKVGKIHMYGYTDFLCEPTLYMHMHMESTYNLLYLGGLAIM